MIDLADPTENLRAFVRVRGSLGGDDVFTWFRANIYAFIPGEDHRHLFTWEGFNVCHFVEIDGGYQFLSRETGFYRDPTTGEILDRWYNPWTDQECEVIPTQNDPSNGRMLIAQRPGGLPWFENGDVVFWPLEIFLRYPHPLPQSQYPQYSGSDTYQAAEMYTFYSRRSDLENATLPNVPAQLSWGRVAPWQPWMAMADRPGMLVYNGAGRKLGGWDEIPADLRERVERQFPAFRQSPRDAEQPDFISNAFTVFKRVLAGRSSE